MTEPSSASTSRPAEALPAGLDGGYVPYVPPPSAVPSAVMTPLGLGDPLRWLARGFKDFIAAPGIGVFYGICFWAMAAVLSLVFRRQPEYVMSIASGCLLIGPFLAMGLYEVSRRREQAIATDFSASLTCWDRHIRSMAMLVLVLIVLELLWGRASLVVFAVFFNTGMPSTTGVLQAIFNPDNMEFVLVYLTVGGIFALLVYSTAVVSIPMILDRDTDAISAAITSIRVVFANPVTMLWWGLLIVLLVTLALIPWGLGLIIAGPLLGHASWHAYRGSVRWQESTLEPAAKVVQ
ncbi:DUF2189 domain-containing protein [Ottowia thiooxydans]|uniref:Membrane protein n=1 Tax=Ottowia thiooxydans TaxID=219182 RepID=A0ABV2QGN5_9BURK